MTYPKVRLALAEEELQDRASGSHLAVYHDDVSPSLWVNTGLEIEQQQYVVYISSKILACSW
jgi:hypothetical protein